MHIESPPQFKRWTITLPSGEAFDAFTENVYDPERRMTALIERAGADAYAEYTDHPHGEPASVRDQFARAARELRRLAEMTEPLTETVDWPVNEALARSLDEFDIAYNLATEAGDA